MRMQWQLHGGIVTYETITEPKIAMRIAVETQPASTDGIQNMHGAIGHKLCDDTIFAPIICGKLVLNYKLRN